MITPQTVKYVAELARIKITEEEIEFLKEQLGKILEYINNLKEVDTDKVEPTRGVFFQENRLREDIPCKKDIFKEILKNAPQKEDNYFKVPKVIE